MNERLVAATHAYEQAATGSGRPTASTSGRYATFRLRASTSHASASASRRPRRSFTQGPQRAPPLRRLRRRVRYFYRIGLRWARSAKKDEGDRRGHRGDSEKDVPGGAGALQEGATEQMLKNELMQEWESPLYELAEHAWATSGRDHRARRDRQAARRSEQDEDRLDHRRAHQARQEEKEGHGQGQAAAVKAAVRRAATSQSNNPANQLPGRARARRASATCAPSRSRPSPVSSGVSCATRSATRSCRR